MKSNVRLRIPAKGKQALVLATSLCLSLSGVSAAASAPIDPLGREAAMQKAVNVTGVVTDSGNLPLPGVTIIEKGTTNGTVTDIDGKYSIEVASPESILVFSFVGMESVEQTVGTSSVLNIVLNDDTQALNEVVVIGYGTQTKREITSAVANVTTEEFVQGGVRSPMELIQGKVAGLNIVRTQGNNPNGSTDIQLRGISSVKGTTQPLIVIDGIPGGNLDLLQQDDIASFDVLKDGSAAAIYGTRGNAGVILITTKKENLDKRDLTTPTTSSGSSSTAVRKISAPNNSAT